MPQVPNDPAETSVEPDLDARLNAARARNGLDTSAKASAPDAAMGMGARIGVEFVAALVVSVGLGVLIDRWLHSSPVALLVLLALGFAAGLLNVYRAMNGMSYTAAYRKPAKNTDET